MNIPRPEYPKPQWKRNAWQNLNGEWEFEFDFSNSALDRERWTAEHLENKIIVPFCPESELSGINYKDFMDAVCYRKEIELSEEALNGRVILHFGAVDYKTTVFVNNKLVGTHIGGYTSFNFDITDYVNVGKNTIFVHAQDDVRSETQCAGKQSALSYSHRCFYTRTTGIWQTVWLEFVPKCYIKSAKFYTNIKDVEVTFQGETEGAGDVEVVVTLEGECVGSKKVYSDGTFLTTVALSKKYLWEIGKGGLYDVEFRFGEDKVESYFGLREVSMEGYKICINGKSVFQRLVLDQGYYRDGIYTAPNDEAFVQDIKLALNAGFNGARLHEKVFEERFLYYADRMGYLVWGEYPNWGIKEYRNHEAFADLLCGWVESVNRDFNHPSIVGWCPVNETFGYIENSNHNKGAVEKLRMHGRLLETVYNVTKAIDNTRPCIDTSGFYHAVTDIYDVHDYDQNPETFNKKYASFGETGDFDLSEYEALEPPFFKDTYTYKKGQPMFVSEYGGIKWDKEFADDPERKISWGYGNGPATEEEFIERYRGLTEVLMNNKNMFGFCYTQLYDIEQERNGLYTYDREPKFDIKIFKEINEQEAAIEKEQI